MNTRMLVGAAGLSGALIAIGQLSVDASSDKSAGDQVRFDKSEPQEAGESYADVFVWSIQGSFNQTGTIDSTSYRAYSVGTTSCNQGNENLIWTGGNSNHPVIGQNVYVLTEVDGGLRFQHLGQGWLKHGFCALDQDECGPCDNGTGCVSLAPGCSDPYTAQRNAGQSGAGPKSQVNATTGAFPYPPGNPSWSGSLARRINVKRADIENSTSTDSDYFIEAQYIHKQDCAAVDVGRARNNVTYGKMNVSNSGSFNGPANYVQMQPAVHAWAEADETVKLSEVQIPGEGTYLVASQVYGPDEDGVYEYEYFVHNLDSHRSVRAVEIPVSDATDVTFRSSPPLELNEQSAFDLYNMRSVPYNSGDGHVMGTNFSNAPWAYEHAGGNVSWSTDDFATDPNANAIRWGTGFNFRFYAKSAPQEGSIELTHYRAGDNAGFSVPDLYVPSEASCVADFDGDGMVGFTDLTQLLSVWGSCPGCPEDIDGDGMVGFTDLTQVLSLWGDC